MVTAKGTEIDTVVALEVGADDYVTKPYRLRELVARMRAVLRRIGRRRAGRPAEVAGRRRRRGAWEAGDVRVDPDQRRVFVRGEEVHLRRKEFELLRLLVENAGRVLTRDVLIDRVWGTDYIGDTKTLDVHIKRLRSRIEERPVDPGAHHHRPRRRLPLRPGSGEAPTWARPGRHGLGRRPSERLIGSAAEIRGPGTSGRRTEPSGWRPVSTRAAQMRAQASAEPLSVWTSTGAPPPAGR